MKISPKRFFFLSRCWENWPLRHTEEIYHEPELLTDCKKRLTLMQVSLNNYRFSICASQPCKAIPYTGTSIYVSAAGEGSELLEYKVGVRCSDGSFGRV